MSLTLYPYQQAGVDEFFSRPFPHRMGVPLPTGTGKSAIAVGIAKELANRLGRMPRVLVCTLAMVRDDWKRVHFGKFWPEAEVALIDVGLKAKMPSKPAEQRRRDAYAAPIRITSYELAANLIEEVDLVVFDEVHELRRSTSKQSQTAQAIMAVNRNTPALYLSATPMPNDIKDLWHPNHLMWPGKWGRPSQPPYDNSWQFLSRYSLKRTSEYGTEWFGLNPDTADELREKLSRAYYQVPPEVLAKYKPAKIVRRWEVEKDCDRPKAVERWCEDAFREGSHLSIQVYERASARNLSKRLQKKFGRRHRIFTITGNDQTEQRVRIRQQWVDAPSGILVSTMKSFGVGISLTKANRALIAELWYVPGDLDQLTGRYARADKATATPVDILVRKGTADERIAEIVIAKAQNIENVTGQSVGESLLAALETPVLEGEDLAAMTRELLMQWSPEDEELIDD